MAWLGQARQSLLFSERKGRAVVGCAMRQRLCLVPSREKVPRYSSTGGSAKSRRKGPTCLRPLSLQGLERSWEKHRRKLHEEANKQYFVSLFLVELKPIFFSPDTVVLHTIINLHSNSQMISLQNELLLKPFVSIMHVCIDIFHSFLLKKLSEKPYQLLGIILEQYFD